MTENTRRVVVLDGSNILHGGVLSKDIDGRRLISAIDWYEKLGYEVIPVIRKRTLIWLTKKRSPGHEQIIELENQDRLIVVDDDDLLVINLALERDGWIITQDTFMDSYERDENRRIVRGEDGVPVVNKKRERSLHPELPWDEIDERTRGTEKQSDGHIRSNKHWSVVDLEFYDPDMPKAPPNYLFSEYENITEISQSIRHLLDKLLSELQKIDSEEDLDAIQSMKQHQSNAMDKVLALESIIPGPRLPPIENLSLMSNEELKEICRSRQLQVSGNKDELIQRLTSSEEAQVEERSMLANASTQSDLEEFTKQEFVDALFKDVEDDSRHTFAALYKKLVIREPNYNLKEIGIKPGLYLKQCSDYIDIEIKLSGGCEAFWIRKKD